MLLESDVNVNDASITSSNKRENIGRIPYNFSPLLFISNQSLICGILVKRVTRTLSMSKSRA